jgi:hypothetical protein
MWRRVDLVWIDVSEERVSISRVETSASEEPAKAGGCRLSHNSKTPSYIKREQVAADWATTRKHPAISSVSRWLQTEPPVENTQLYQAWAGGCRLSHHSKTPSYIRREGEWATRENKKYERGMVCGDQVGRPYPCPLYWFPMWPNSLPLPVLCITGCFRLVAQTASHVLTPVPRSRTFLPRRWRRYAPPKRVFTQDLHGATSQKTAFFKHILMRTTICNTECVRKLGGPQGQCEPWEETKGPLRLTGKKPRLSYSPARIGFTLLTGLVRKYFNAKYRCNFM